MDRFDKIWYTGRICVGTAFICRVCFIPKFLREGRPVAQLGVDVEDNIKIFFFIE